MRELVISLPAIINPTLKSRLYKSSAGLVG